MLVTFTLLIATDATPRVAFVEREVEMPFAPYDGLMVNGLGPEEGGKPLTVQSSCWNHDDQSLKAHLGDLYTGDVDVDAEAAKWEAAGWTIREIVTLDGRESSKDGDYYPLPDEFGAGHLASAPAIGTNIRIVDSTVYIYNGNAGADAR